MVCTKTKVDCAQVDKQGNCIKCVDSKNLAIDKTCVATCPTPGGDIESTAGDIATGYFM